MTRPGLVLCLLLALLAPTAAPAQQRVLRGVVLLVDKNDKTRPASKGEVWLLGFGNPTRIASEDGSFRLFLPETLQPADPITLVVKIEGYHLWSPPEGKTHVPKNLATQFVELRVLPSGSKRFLSDEAIERLIRIAAEKSKEQTKTNEAPQRFELGRYIKDWALQYGFSAEQVRAEVDKWVTEVEKNRDDERRLALAAFARGDFQKASEHAEASVERRRQQLEQLEQSVREMEQKKMLLREGISLDLELVGDARLQRGEFTGALESYTQALEYASRTENPERWAALMTSVGAAHWYLGTHAANARERLDWAMTQNNPGAAPQAQSKRTEDEARALLSRAVEAYRLALSVYTREAQPQDWAMTQNNLGTALQEQGERTGGEAGALLLSQAVEAYRLALSVYTREAQPRDWAMTQYNLGMALRAQGERTGGEAGALLLSRAVEAYRLALSVYTREAQPRDWAMTQYNLGMALQRQGERTGGEAGTLLLSQAVEAYRLALFVHTREALPKDWAMTQNNLGNALRLQGERTRGEARDLLLSQAVKAYRLALSGYTREARSQHWAITQRNLELALRARRR